MARLGVNAATLVVGALLWSSFAKADPITVNAAPGPGGTPVTTIVNAMVSPIAFAGQSESGFILTGSGVGTPPDVPGRFSSNTISVGSSAAGQEILVWFTEQNLTNTSGLPLVVTSGLTANLLFDAKATLSTYLDPTNGVAPPTGTPLATQDFTAHGAQSFTTVIPSPTGTYSLQELYVITALAPDESTNLTIDLLATPIPEPSSLALLGTGLLGLALFLFKRKRSATRLVM